MNQIYLDVDGCLNPITTKCRSKHWLDYKKYDITINNRPMINPFSLRIWLSKEMGREILKISEKYDAEIVWSTTWLDDANTYISPILGFSSDMRVTNYRPQEDFDMNNSGKISSIAEMSDDNNIVIIDDYLGFADRAWIDNRNEIGPYPTLGIKPVESIGITKDHLDKICQFFDSL